MPCAALLVTACAARGRQTKDLAADHFSRRAPVPEIRQLVADDPHLLPVIGVGHKALNLCGD